MSFYLTFRATCRNEAVEVGPIEGVSIYLDTIRDTVEGEDIAYYSYNYGDWRPYNLGMYWHNMPVRDLPTGGFDTVELAWK